NLGPGQLDFGRFDDWGYWWTACVAPGSNPSKAVRLTNIGESTIVVCDVSQDIRAPDGLQSSVLTVKPTGILPVRLDPCDVRVFYITANIADNPAYDAARPPRLWLLARSTAGAAAVDLNTPTAAHPIRPEQRAEITGWAERLCRLEQDPDLHGVVL